MKFLKTLFLLSISTLAINAWAGTFTISTVKNNTEYTNGKYNEIVYEDGDTILPNEAMRILVIQAKSGIPQRVYMNPTDLFSIDIFGNFVCKEKIEVQNGSTTVSYDIQNEVIASIFWAEDSKAATIFRATENATFGEQNLSAPPGVGIANCDCVRVTFSTPWDETFYVYVVMLDTRYVDTDSTNDATYAIDTAFKGVNKWSAVYASSVSQFSYGGSADTLFTSDCLDGIDLSSVVCIDYVAPFMSPVLPEKLTGIDGKIYEGDAAITDYLTPSCSATTILDDGLALTCSSPDVLTYTLQTKASLSEDWDSMDSVIENLSNETKNSLANNLEKRYTYLRVKESTQIKIPKLPGETQRFYRLIAE